MESLDQRVKALTELKGEERSKVEAEVKRERVRLLKPLDDIFEQELKPRLEKLPTRAQRKATEEGEKTAGQTTKPDSGGGEKP